MAVDAAAWVRAGSGLVFIAVGLVVGWATRGSPRPGGGALATFCVAFGTSFVLVNFLGYDAATAPFAILAQQACFIAAAVAVVALAWRGPWTDAGVPAREVRLVLVGAGVNVLAFYVAIRPLIWAIIESNGWAVSREFALSTLMYAAGVGVAAVHVLAAVPAVLAARAAARSASGATRKALAALAVATFAYGAFNAGWLGATSSHVGAYAFAAAAFAPALVVAAAWLAVPGLGRHVAWAVLGVALVGVSEPLWGAHLSASIGIVRTVAAVGIALAVLRYDLFGTTRSARQIERGSLAAGALAVLFIVAQVAQNFLSDAYGLLTGGVVAGAFLFAAHPLQRAMERFTAGADVAPGRAAPVTARHEDVYRDALRVALRDRVVTREEEVRLHRVAEGLGIGAGRAHEILLEVEREQEARA